MTTAHRFEGLELSLIRKIMEKAPKGAINMALGELKYPMPKSLISEGHKHLNAATPVYTPNAGIPELRSLIASSYNDTSTLENICVCNGAEEAAYLSLLSLCNTGDTIAIPDPDYTAYPAIAKLLECKVTRLPYEDDLTTINWHSWEENLKSNVKVLILSCPQNPSGKYFNSYELNILSTICNRYGITVIVDQIYDELHIDDHELLDWHCFDNLIRISGLSKSHCLSGWRIGWVNAPTPVTQAITKAKQYVSTCSAWLSQQLAISAMSEIGRMAASEIKLKLTRSHDMAKELLAPIGKNRLHIPNAGPYFMIKLNTNDLIVAEDLASRGVLTVPGSAFGKVSENFLRINYAIPDIELSKGCSILVEHLTEI